MARVQSNGSNGSFNLDAGEAKPVARRIEGVGNAPLPEPDVIVGDGRKVIPANSIAIIFNPEQLASSPAVRRESATKRGKIKKNKTVTLAKLRGEESENGYSRAFYLTPEGRVAQIGPWRGRLGFGASAFIAVED